jgi:hypothetical protein
VLRKEALSAKQGDSGDHDTTGHSGIGGTWDKIRSLTVQIDFCQDFKIKCYRHKSYEYFQLITHRAHGTKGKFYEHKYFNKMFGLYEDMSPYSIKKILHLFTPSVSKLLVILAFVDS